MLKVLNLAGNNINKIEQEAFSLLTNLQTLDLTANFLLTNLNDGMFKGLKSLQERIMDSNNIIEIGSGTFSYMLNLHFLYLSDNQLKTLNSNIFGSKGIPKNLSVSLEDNPFLFDDRLCWLQAAELEGRINFMFLQPECTNIPDIISGNTITLPGWYNYNEWNCFNSSGFFSVSISVFVPVSISAHLFTFFGFFKLRLNMSL